MQKRILDWIRHGHIRLERQDILLPDDASIVTQTLKNIAEAGY